MEATQIRELKETLIQLMFKYKENYTVFDAVSFELLNEMKKFGLTKELGQKIALELVQDERLSNNDEIDPHLMGLCSVLTGLNSPEARLW